LIRRVLVYSCLAEVIQWNVTEELLRGLEATTIVSNECRALALFVTAAWWLELRRLWCDEINPCSPSCAPESGDMIKHKLLFVALMAASIALPALVQAQGIQIQIGERDRPYYTHGPRYWEGNSEMVWVGGHTWHHHWIRGHYVRRSHHRHDFEQRHDERRDFRDGDRYEEQRGDYRR